MTEIPQRGLQNAKRYNVIAEVRAMLEVSSAHHWLAVITLVIRLMPVVMQSIDSLNDLTVRPIPAAGN